MFIGTISRGRTIRQVVFGAFLAPIVYSFFFLGVLGHLGIKMQRITELSLNQPPLGTGINLNGGTVNCTAMGYDGGVPASSEAIALADKGYFPLQCRGHNDRFWDVLMPYGEGIYMFLGIISLIGVVFYFVTSSVRCLRGETIFDAFLRRACRPGTAACSWREQGGGFYVNVI